MESPFAMLDNVKFEKETAIARFNRARGLLKLWQIVEVVVAFAFAAVLWCSARAPAVARSTGACLSDFSAYLFNHHVAFLIGNSIIVLIFMLCRQSDGGATAGRRDFYDVYVKYSEAVRALPPPQQGEEAAPPAKLCGGGGGDKQIVAVRADEAVTSSQCDDVAVAIEKASRQIRKFQRIRSEMMRREISVRRSETENSRKTKSLEELSNEEFRRRADAFIHWFKRTTKLEGNESFQSQLREYYHDFEG